MEGVGSIFNTLSDSSFIIIFTTLMFFDFVPDIGL